MYNYTGSRVCVSENDRTLLIILLGIGIQLIAFIMSAQWNQYFLSLVINPLEVDFKRTYDFCIFAAISQVDNIVYYN